MVPQPEIPQLLRASRPRAVEEPVVIIDAPVDGFDNVEERDARQRFEQSEPTGATALAAHDPRALQPLQNLPQVLDGDALAARDLPGRRARGCG